MSVPPSVSFPSSEPLRKHDGVGHTIEAVEHLRSALELIDEAGGPKDAAAYVQMALDALAASASDGS